MKTHFIFDFDDTLVASNDYNQDMFYQTFTKHYPDINEQLVRDVHKASRGTSMRAQFTQIVNDLELDIDPDLLVKENEELHTASFHKVLPFDSTENLLKELKSRNKKISICTNRQKTSLLTNLEKNNLVNYFDNVVSCFDSGTEKPNPQCLLAIIAQYDEPKENYVFFGDSMTDYKFASNAGIDSIIIDQYANDKKFFTRLVEMFLN